MTDKQITKYFKTSELLPKGYIDTTVLDVKLLKLIDEVRELLDVPCTINIEGRQYCGYRPSDCTIGAPNSYHKKGKAADLHPIGMSAEDARTLVRKAVSQGLLKDLGGVELEVSWLHIDTRPRYNNEVLWFKG
jgi:uncharacterized protein YcbK (DUF882 family)